MLTLGQLTAVLLDNLQNLLRLSLLTLSILSNLHGTNGFLFSLVGMTDEREESDAWINSSERGGIRQSQNCPKLVVTIIGE